jgi:PKD repeat protein
LVDAEARTVSGSHVYADEGTYVVRVTVTDDDGDSGTDELTMEVLDAPPVVIAGGEASVDEGVLFELPFTFFTDNGTVESHTATVDFGDGTVVAG